VVERGARGSLFTARLREDAAAWSRQKRLEWLYRNGQLAEALSWKQRSLLSQEEALFLLASTHSKEQLSDS